MDWRALLWPMGRLLHSPGLVYILEFFGTCIISLVLKDINYPLFHDILIAVLIFLLHGQSGRLHEICYFLIYSNRVMKKDTIACFLLCIYICVILCSAY